MGRGADGDLRRSLLLYAHFPLVPIDTVTDDVIAFAACVSIDGEVRWFRGFAGLFCPVLRVLCGSAHAQRSVSNDP